MKRINVILALTLLIFTLGCKNDTPEPEPYDVFIERYTGSWTTNFVSLDGEDLTPSFTGLQVTVTSAMGFTTNSASVERQPNPWPASGSFNVPAELASADNVVISRNDGVSMTLAFADEKNVTVSFTFAAGNQGSGGRVEQVEGAWVFEFTKN